MSVGLSDIFGSDILDESRFKPWWEKIREYAMRGLMVTSFLALSVELTAKQTQCSPRYPTPNYTMSSTQSQVANEVCYHQQDPKMRFAGIIAISTATFLYMCFSLWLLSPNVISTFSTVKRIDDTLTNENFASKEVEEIISTPIIAEKGLRKLIMDALQNRRDELEGKYPNSILRKPDTVPEVSSTDAIKRKHIIHGLFSDKYQAFTNQTPICCWYLMRNIVSTVVGITLIVLDVFAILLYENSSSLFYCHLTGQGAVVTGTTDFVCSTDLPTRLYPYAITYAIFTAVLCIVGIFASIWTLYLRRTIVLLKECANRNTAMDNYIIQNFSYYSRYLHMSTHTLLKLGQKGSLLDKMNDDYIAAIVFGDSDFVDRYLMVYEKGKENVDIKLESLNALVKLWIEKYVWDTSVLGLIKRGIKRIQNELKVKSNQFSANAYLKYELKLLNQNVESTLKGIKNGEGVSLKSISSIRQLVETLNQRIEKLKYSKNNNAICDGKAMLERALIHISYNEGQSPNGDSSNITQDEEIQKVANVVQNCRRTTGVKNVSSKSNFQNPVPTSGNSLGPNEGRPAIIPVQEIANNLVKTLVTNSSNQDSSLLKILEKYHK